MTRSSLCTYTRITGNRNRGRSGQRVCKITPHYMCASWTGRQCADYFASTARQASSNYCIGISGDIAMSVDEDDRAWTSASKWNDDRAITIECANLADSSLTDATWRSLVNLCADICRRYNFRLSYDGSRGASLTEHRMYASTDCPGAWLHANMRRLASEVNAKLDGAAAPEPSAPAHTATGKTGTGFGGEYTVSNTDTLNVRTAPSTSSKITGTLPRGYVVTLDDWYCISGGWVWGRYQTNAGNTRYVAVGRPTGGYDSGDFLVKGGTKKADGRASGVYRVLVDRLNVRSGPGTGYGKVAWYGRGNTVTLDGTFAEADGYVWGRYTGGSGYKRWVAIGTADGSEKYAELA